MSLDAASTFLGLVSAGTALPALALVVGFPDAVCTGLGRPFASWKASPEGSFGLFLYTVSDICLGALCAASLTTGSAVSKTLALNATMVHQFAYLAAAIPAFGFRPDHIPCVVAGALAGLLSYRTKD